VSWKGKILKKAKQEHAALYLRLSRDDGGDAESNSIQTQRMMLQRYARENGFEHCSEYVDDGWSGISFERPQFKRLIEDIEEGRVTAVICKDLSRLGRNNAMVAYFTEIMFPSRDIRFIAINDGIDSATGDNEIMAFKSIINEWYARDISKKIRSSKHTRALAGEFSGHLAPLGYRKDPNDKHHLLVEEEGARIVRYIFKMAVQGLSTTQIAERLNSESIITPREHFNGRGGVLYQQTQPKHPPQWTTSTIRNILRNRTYLGSVVNGRSTTKSFKDRKRVSVPPEDHIVIPNMHPPLVTEEDFDIAQRVIRIKQRTNLRQWDNVFQGLLKCADCGCNLSYTYAPRVSFGGYYMCNRYRYRPGSDSALCTNHYTPVNTLTDAVLHEIRRQAIAAKAKEGDLRAYAEKTCESEASKALVAAQRKMQRTQRRRDELETIIRRLVEQNALGLITDERFVSMSAGYEKEQVTLSCRLAELQEQLSASQSAVDCMEKFLLIVQKYVDIESLDRGVLNEVIDHIVVHSGEGKSPTRKQKLEFHFRFAEEEPANRP